MFDWDDINDYHRKLDSEFAKLINEPSARVPQVGDKVLVAVGLLGMGYLWVRLEAEVIETADTSYKVRFTDRKKWGSDELQEEWVHQALITDVVSCPGEDYQI